MSNMRSLIIDNKRMKNCTVNGDFSIPFFSTETETQEIKGREGSVQSARNINELRFTIPMTYTNSENKTNNEIMTEITNYIDYDSPVNIRIDGEDWHWIGTFDGAVELSFFKHIYYNFELNVVLTDPFRYSHNTYNNTAISDQLTVVNSGTAKAPFELTATAYKDAPFFAVVDENEQHFMIGEDSEDEKIGNYSPSLLVHELTTTAGWSKLAESEGIPDNRLGGKVGASATQNPSGWALNLSSIPQKTGWRGFGYKRSFSRSAKNFKTKVKFFVRNSTKGSGKVAQFIYDDTNRLIFSVGYHESSTTKHDGKIIFIAHNQAGEEKVLWTNNIPLSMWKVQDMTVYASIERVGEKISMRTWLYNELNDTTRNKPLHIKDRVFMDRGKFYQRKIGSIALGSFRANGNYKLMNILGTFNYELLDMPVGASDLFIKKGDIIVLDTRDNFITVNGEPYMVKKSFSSRFFRLYKGLGALLISPEDTFDTKIRWKDRYK